MNQDTGNVAAFLSRLLVIILLTLWALPLYAQSDADTEQWQRATIAMEEGNNAEAVRLLHILSTNFPLSKLADDALLLEAQLWESKLANPARASDMYQTLVQKYPDSRSALAASRHLRSLQKSLGPSNRGAAPLAAFNTILSEFPNRPEKESESLAKALLQKYPQWQGRSKVLLWLAELARRHKRWHQALHYYQEVLSTDDRELRVQASFSTIEILILQEEHAQAQTTLEQLMKQDDFSSGEVQVIAELQEKLATSKREVLTLSLSISTFFSSLFLLLALHWRSCAGFSDFHQRLRKPPLEFFYLVPFSILFIAMAMTGHEEIGPAVVIICVGSLIITWLTGVTMIGLRPLRISSALLCAILATLATLSVCYYALYRSHLLELVATTIQFGPE